MATATNTQTDDPIIEQMVEPWVQYQGGTKFTEQPPTVKHALNEAGLNWGIKKADVYGQTPDDDVVKSDKVMIYRTDTKREMGIVSDRYQTIHNAEALSIVDTMLNEADEQNIGIHSAGELQGGKRVWMVLDFGNDEIEGEQFGRYMLTMTGHDGKRAVFAKFLPYRIACRNQIPGLIGHGAGDVRIEHTGDTDGKIDHARNILKSASSFFDDFAQAVRNWVNTDFNQSQMRTVAERLYPEDEDGERSTNKVNKIERLVELFHSGQGITSRIEETAWAGINAVTEFTDHHRTVRATGESSSAEARVSSLWDGSSGKFKENAIEEVNAVAGLR